MHSEKASQNAKMAFSKWDSRPDPILTLCLACIKPINGFGGWHFLPIFQRDINPRGIKSIWIGLYVLISNYHWGKKKGDKVWVYLGAEMLRFIFSVIRLPCYPSKAPSRRKEWKAQGRLYFLQTFINQDKKLWMQNWHTTTKSILNWGKATEYTDFLRIKEKILT